MLDFLFLYDEDSLKAIVAEACREMKWMSSNLLDEGFCNIHYKSILLYRVC